VDANGLSRDLIQIVSLRECYRRQVIETSLRALPVIKYLDVFADGSPGFIARGEASMMDQLAF
jgi:hypothetical protein